MSSRNRRPGGDRAKDSTADNRKMIEAIREATGASAEEVEATLKECNFDANETTSKLIDNPFSQVQSKRDKKKKKDVDPREQRKEPSGKVMEIRRSSNAGGRGRGADRERGGRADRSTGPKRDPSSAQHQHPAQSPAPGPSTVDVSFATTDEEPKGGSWDFVDQELDKQDLQQTLSWGDKGTSAPSQTSTQQPIGKAPAPAPIRPPAQGGSQTRSMADLFKPKPAQPQAPQETLAHKQNHYHQPEVQSQSNASLPGSTGHSLLGENSSLVNGWGPTTSDQEVSRQGEPLGGIAVPAPQKPLQGGQAAIQAGSASGSLPQATPTASQPVIGSNQWPTDDQSSSDNKWGPPPSASGALGGLSLDSSSRQAYLPEHSSWMSKPSSSQGPSIGDSILSALTANPTPDPSDPLSIASPQHSDLNAAASSFNASQSPMLSAQGSKQAPTTRGLQFGTFSGLGNQFDNLNLSHPSAESSRLSSSPYSSAFTQANQPELQGGAGPAGDAFKPAPSYSQPASSMAQAQQQKAYSAFNSATPGQVSSASQQAAQKPAAAISAAPETSTAGSQGLYTSQALQSLGGGSSGQGYNQYQYPGSQQGYQQAYNNYQESEQQAPAPATPQTSQGLPKRGQSTTSSQSYDPATFSYAQGQAGRDFPPPGYSAPAAGEKYGTAAQATSGFTPSNGAHNAAAALAQNQMGGYHSQLSGIPQNFYGGNQQYNYPGYNNYSQGSGSYGYGPSSAYQQQAGYGQHGSTAYAQGGKYGAGYGGTGGGYQHGGGYGGQSHKQDKEHQAAHLGGHNLYGQQQLPLGGRQHFAGHSLQDQYSYQNPGQGYNAYSRQYGQNYYGQNQ